MINGFFSGNAPFFGPSLGSSFGGDAAESIRSFTEDHIAQTQAHYATLKNAGEAGNEAIEAAFDTASRNASAYTARMLEMSKENTESAVNLGLKLMTTTSLSEAIELWSGGARSQIEAFVAQSRELAAWGQQMASEAAENLAATPASQSAQTEG